MMLLVSLPEIDSEGEGLRISSACLMVEAAASDADVSDIVVSWKIQVYTNRININNA